MTSRAKSSRSWLTWFSIASTRSVSMDRSWTSSTITADTAGRSGSFSRRRSSSPAVTNSMRVAWLVACSPRTENPMRSPTEVLSNDASLRAAARAAIRRGWVTMMRPCNPWAASALATAGGTMVVFPEPGGASITCGSSSPWPRFCWTCWWAGPKASPEDIRSRSNSCPGLLMTGRVPAGHRSPRPPVRSGTGFRRGCVPPGGPSGRWAWCGP